MAKMYCKAMDQYLEKGWAVQLTPDEIDRGGKPVFYLPHHGVYRPDKPSTPLRIVFDPACTYKGVSLNSLLYKGPCLIGDLFGVLLRFREEPVAFIGDISKMFLQVCLTEEDTHVHRFLWRDMDVSSDPKVYRLTRVTFGDKPSPSMASFVVLKVADEFQSRFPEAAVLLKRDGYVDDIIHSCATFQEADKLKAAMEEILGSASFQIKEWICSSDVRKEHELQTVQDHDNGCTQDVSLDGQDSVKTLGVCWKPTTDMLHFQVKEMKTDILTKRMVLSRLSMIYDPLGLAAAVTIKTRIAMQNTWKLGIEWDDPLPEDYQDLWCKLFEELKGLEGLEIPRCEKPDAIGRKAELHVFTDASSVAYGAIAYIRTKSPGSSTPYIQLIAAKARVAPLRQTTIPRLELAAALIGSRLAKTIHEELRTDLTTTIWTDSRIVLHWIKSESHNLKQFVGVRVAEIQVTWDPSHWRFVPTDKNPADELSRGLKVTDLKGRFKGPEFLIRSEKDWPEQPDQGGTPLEDPERKQPKKLVCAVTKGTSFIECRDFSDWHKMLRVTAWCNRFLYNARNKDKRSGTLSPSEIETSERYWILKAQEDLGDWEQRCSDLSPFETEGIVRVGGRLKRSNLSYDQVHPVLLPGSSHIAKLVMTDAHSKAIHPGAERTLCETRRNYWVTRGRNLAKLIVRNCIVCRKLRQPPHTTLMADLPPERVKVQSPPFSTTGVDLFGPFNLRYGRNQSKKAWGAIFTCGTVRAVHLEIVDDLSTQAFLQALRRFVGTHGWPTTIISDNGTSFVGTEKELKRLVQAGRQDLKEFAMLHSVTWKFITPLSPNQGGFYESLIKQVKRAMKVIGDQRLTWNEMSTVFAEVKALVNSRPIGYSSNDPNDLQPLTPNHFLLGRASVEIPQGPFEETKNLHKRFEFVQAMVKQIWRRFISEYLPTLTRRVKWKTKGRQLKPGDVVLLVDSTAPRGRWDMGRLLEVFPGQDGVIRNVKVKTKNGEYKRSVQRCCLLLEAES